MSPVAGPKQGVDQVDPQVVSCEVQSPSAAPGSWMQRAGRRRAFWVLLAIVPGIVLAQASGGTYGIRKQVIASGVAATGGSYRLVGTLGQVAAGPQNNGNYRVSGGFHFAPNAGSGGIRLFCNGFENSACP